MSVQGKAYIQNKLDPIMYALTVATFEANPADPVEFMLNYMKKHHGN